MKSKALDEARANAERLAAEAIQLEEAGNYREALAKLERALPHVGMWDDPVFEVGFYSSMATLNDTLGYPDAAARFTGMSVEASKRCREHQTIADILREYYDRMH